MDDPAARPASGAAGMRPRQKRRALACSTTAAQADTPPQPPHLKRTTTGQETRMSTDPNNNTAADPAASTDVPAADDAAELDYLHPDNLRLGSIGVFAGDWAWTDGPDGGSRIGVGFVGVLIDTWNGWAVFRCTREVAEAIVADQQQHRLQYREGLRDADTAEADLDRMVDEAYTSLVFDGDTIVADQRVMYDDPQAIERITPDIDGRRRMGDPLRVGGGSSRLTPVAGAFR